MPPLDNATIAERLETLAALLDLAGASFYSVRAYRRAAELIKATPAPVAELVRTGRVRELRGIGPAIETRLQELVETGTLAEIEELEVEYDAEALDIGFNSRYLLDITAQLEGEKAELKLADPGSPTLLRDQDAAGALYVLMPMRV